MIDSSEERRRSLIPALFAMVDWTEMPVPRHSSLRRILTSSLRNGFAVIAGGACEASVSKDGRNVRTRGHPSRRAHRTAQVRCRESALLRMRSEIYSQPRSPGRRMETGTTHGETLRSHVVIKPLSQSGIGPI